MIKVKITNYLGGSRVVLPENNRVKIELSGIKLTEDVADVPSKFFINPSEFVLNKQLRERPVMIEKARTKNDDKQGTKLINNDNMRA